MSGGDKAFAPSVDAASYVPNAATERVLGALGEWAVAGERPVRVLRGPEGAGKSMLLAVLAARVGRHAAPILVSAVGLDPDSLARRVLDALGTPWDGSPRIVLAAAIQRLGKPRVLLLIDDADALTPRTEMWLFDLARRSAGGLRALLAVRDERLAADLANAFQAGTEVLTIEPVLSREETETWLRAELARAEVGPDARARFDASALARIHERSGGVPGRVRQEAIAVLTAVAEAAATARVAGAPGQVTAPPPLPPERLAVRVAGESGAVPPPGAPAPRHEPRDAIPRERARTNPAPASEATPARRAFEPPAREAAALASESTSSAAGAASSTREASSGRVAPRRALRPSAAPGSPQPPASTTARRESLLRWLLPAALAAAFVAGFLTAQMLATLRPAPALPPGLVAEPDSAAATPPVSAAPPPGSGTASAAPSPSAEASPSADRAAAPATPPPATLRGHDPFAAPAPPAAATPPAVSASPREFAPEPGPADDLLVPPPTATASPSAMAPERPRPPLRTAEGSRGTAVDVTAEPGASILVDGRPVGSGTVNDLRLEPGPHRVEVRLPDGRVVERVVEVRGTRYEINVR